MIHQQSPIMLTLLPRLTMKLYQALPDVVLTQGRHLLSRPETPVFGLVWTHAHFVPTLQDRLDLLTTRLRLRSKKYGKEIADEWPISRTPAEIVQNHWITVLREGILSKEPIPLDRAYDEDPNGGYDFSCGMPSPSPSLIRYMEQISDEMDRECEEEERLANMLPSSSASKPVKREVDRGTENHDDGILKTSSSSATTSSSALKEHNGYPVKDENEDIGCNQKEVDLSSRTPLEVEIPKSKQSDAISPQHSHITDNMAPAPACAYVSNATSQGPKKRRYHDDDLVSGSDISRDRPVKRPRTSRTTRC